MAIFTSSVTTASNGNLTINPAGAGEIKLTKLSGSGEIPLGAAGADGEVKAFDHRELSALSAVDPGDLVLVQRGSDYYTFDASEFKGSVLADPDPSNISWLPSNPPGSGTQGDPFRLTPITVSTPGGTGSSIEIMVVSGMKPDSIIPIYDESSAPASGRFNQTWKLCNNSGEASFDFSYLDAPASDSGEVYNGVIKVGTTTVFVTWEVTQRANKTVFGPASQPTASPTTVDYVADGKYGTVSATWADGSHTLTATNMVFSVNGGGLDDGTKSISDGDKIVIGFVDAQVAAAAEGDTISGTLESSDGAYSNTISLIKKTTPAPFTIVAGVDRELSAETYTGNEPIVGINAPTPLTATGSGANPLTSVTVSVDGGPKVASATFNPGDPLQGFGTTGAVASTTQQATFTLGGVAATWDVTTSSVSPTIEQPTITSPLNGATDLAPDVVVTGDAYNPLNGAGAHSSSDWEVYEAVLAPVSTSVITGFAGFTGPFTTNFRSAGDGDGWSAGTSVIINSGDSWNTSGNIKIFQLDTQSFTGDWVVKVTSVNSPSQMRVRTNTDGSNSNTGQTDLGTGTYAEFSSSGSTLDINGTPTAYSNDRYVYIEGTGAGNLYLTIEAGNPLPSLTLADDTNLSQFYAGTDIVQDSGGAPETSAITNVSSGPATTIPTTGGTFYSNSGMTMEDFLANPSEAITANHYWYSKPSVSFTYVGAVVGQVIDFYVYIDGDEATQIVTSGDISNPSTLTNSPLTTPAVCPDIPPGDVSLTGPAALAWLDDFSQSGKLKVSFTLSATSGTFQLALAVAGPPPYIFCYGRNLYGGSPVTLTLTNNTNLANFRVGDEVNRPRVTLVSNTTSISDENALAFWETGSRFYSGSGSISWTFDPPIKVTSCALLVDGGTPVLVANGSVTGNPGAMSGADSQGVSCSNFNNLEITSLEYTGGSGAWDGLCDGWDPAYGNKNQPNVRRFLNQTEIKVTSIDTSNNKMTVDGGTFTVSETVIGPTLLPATGTVGALDVAAKTITLSTSDQTSGKRWLVTEAGYETAKKLNKTVTNTLILTGPGAPTTEPPSAAYTSVTPSAETLTSATLDDSNLNENKAYYSRVAYSDGTITSEFSEYNEFVTASVFTPNAGDPIGGGYFMGQINDNGVIYNLIAAPKLSGGLQGQYDDDGSGRSTMGFAVGSGDPNGYEVMRNDVWGAPAMEALGDDTFWTAFNWCKTNATGPNAGVYDATNSTGTGIGGFNDWYIPAKGELACAYFYMKPGASGNETTWGRNPYSVEPYTPNTNYGPGFPEQTTLPLFKQGGSEQWASGTSDKYASASESNTAPTCLWDQTFSTGSQRREATKNAARMVRAIRRVLAQ